MKVISLTEPMATLIAQGHKKIETRSWKTKYRGEIYIHASLTKIRKEWKNNEKIMSLLDNDKLHYGEIICKCNLVDCVYMTEDFINELEFNNYQEYICGIYEVGRYAWILEDVQLLEEPIVSKGTLGIWNYEPKDNILDNILPTVKYVSDNSKYVTINYDKLDNIIKNIDLNKINFWLKDNPFNILDLNYIDIINFLFIYHTIGLYCFWGEPKWAITTEYGQLDGSYALMYLVLKRYKEHKDFNMTFEEFKLFLGGVGELPLIRSRYNNLVEMNKFIKKNGNFYDAIKNMYSDKELFTYIISNLKCYKDEEVYNGHTIYFYKRAQLLTSDILKVRELLEDVKVSYSNLVGCADYKIPQVMRNLGILEFDEELSFLVDNKILIDDNSTMEIEIRANTLIVIDYIANKLENKFNRNDINDYIWCLGQDKSKMIKPYHRTLTNHY